MTTKREQLHLITLDKEGNARTCNYWYLVRERSMPHTAFRTRAGLIRWLDERGLKLTASLPEHGAHSVQAIEGAYREEWHYTPDEVAAFDAITTCVESRTLSNGDYVVAKITQDADGVRTVHTLNPNVHTRRVFDYFESNRLMDGDAP